LDKRYLRLLAREFPSAEAAASEIINLSAIRSLPKGTEYFFSDLHGEYQAFGQLLRNASGMIRSKIDMIFDKSIPAEDREALAVLIYRPEETIKALTAQGEIDDEWRRITVYRLILVCDSVSAKYTRSDVRRKMPQAFAYILDELLNVTDDINKDFYYDEIIASILTTGIAESFIIAVCGLIRALTIDRLHIIGDIFDRGPRADKIMNDLMTFEHVDIQWGNHDISWMGAASGNTALIANVIRIALSYNSYDVLEDGYGLNLRPLSIFAAEVYEDDPCTRFLPHTLDAVMYDSVDMSLTAKMHKAIAVIQCKLEGQLLKRHPEYHMDDRRLFEKVDFRRGTIRIGDQVYTLPDNNFPTVDPDNPLELTDKEGELMRILAGSFHHSALLNEHIRFLYAKGGMYKVCNGNLLYHGCIPLNEDGTLKEIYLPFTGKEHHGKELLDCIGKEVRQAYFAPFDTPEQIEARDFLWYLWCGADSPLFGKSKMAFFERSFIDSSIPEAKEEYVPYYGLNDDKEVCGMILAEFGLDPDKGHIINGHVPVLLKKGQSPIRAGGRLFVIDGGISKAYRGKTGIAGYTLIYDSHSLRMAEHCAPEPGTPPADTPTVRIVEKMENRVNVADTDYGKELEARIADIRELLTAYRNGMVLGE